MCENEAHDFSYSVFHIYQVHETNLTKQRAIIFVRYIDVEYSTLLLRGRRERCTNFIKELILLPISFKLWGSFDTNCLLFKLKFDFDRTSGF